MVSFEFKTGDRKQLYVGDNLCGRNRRNYVNAHQPTKSRFHCIFNVQSNNVTIKKLHTTNSSYINEHKLLEQSFQLKHGDLIYLGVPNNNIHHQYDERLDIFEIFNVNEIVPNNIKR